MMTIARRLPSALALLAAVLAALACAVLVAPQQARAAAPSYTLTLSASSGSYTDADTLTATLTGCPSGDYSEDIIYQGTSSWNEEAINAANGDYGSSAAAPYLDFAFSVPPADTASWPANTQFAYQSLVSGPSYSTTADLVAALGTGPYTLAAACVTSGNTQAPVLDSSGNPIAASLAVQLNASSWSVASLNPVTTNTTLTGTSVPLSGAVTLTGTVTTVDGSAPSGGFNFYLYGQQSALNGSAPVPVGSDGSAQWTGQLPAGTSGVLSFTAQFVPGSGSPDASSENFGSVTVIVEEVTINYTLTQDPVTPTSADLTATETITGTDPITGEPDSPASTGISVTVDGSQVSAPAGGEVTAFSPTGVATYQVQNLSDGNHSIGLGFVYDYDNVLWNSPTSGIAVTFSPANSLTVGIGPYTTSTQLSLDSSGGGVPQLTAVVTGQTSTGGPVVSAPAGVVSFKDGSTNLGTQALTWSSGASSAASVPVYSLPAGVNHLTATYTPLGTALFAGSSGALQVNVPKTKTWVQAGLPVITGKAAVGNTLTVKPGSWGPGKVSLAYQWYADGSAIRGATGSTLVLGTAEFGKYIAADVTGSEQGDISSDAFTPARGPVGKGTLKSSVPKITGAARVNDTLRVVGGSWTAGTSFRYQWYANGRAILEKTSSSLKLAAAEKGKRITVAVTGVKTDYTTITKTSARTGSVAR
jgi:hypothetical protein